MLANLKSKIPLKMIIVEAYKEFWTRAFDYRGKTKRNFYWFSLLASNIVSFIIAIPEFLGSFTVLYIFASVLASVAMSVRRLRDTGRAWQWIFIFFVPILGPITLLTFHCFPSDSFDDYKPKQITTNK